VSNYLHATTDTSGNTMLTMSTTANGPTGYVAQLDNTGSVTLATILQHSKIS
jgi:hypothetical protein